MIAIARNDSETFGLRMNHSSGVGGRTDERYAERCDGAGRGPAGDLRGKSQRHSATGIAMQAANPSASRVR